MKLRLIKEIQISRQMTKHGQTLGVFKRENDKIYRNGEKTKLQKETNNVAAVYSLDKKQRQTAKILGKQRL